MKHVVKKYYLIILFLLVIFLPFTIENCIKHDNVTPKTVYKPVFISRKDLEKSVSTLQAQPFKSPGKIYIKQPYLFINKPGEGYYVFDNSDPSNPQNIAFIKAIGSYDIAIKGNTLYFDNAVDLVSAIYNPATNTITLSSRIKDKFSEPTPPDNLFVPTEFNNASRRGDSIIINWVKN